MELVDDEMVNAKRKMQMEAYVDYSKYNRIVVPKRHKKAAPVPYTIIVLLPNR